MDLGQDYFLRKSLLLRNFLPHKMFLHVSKTFWNISVDFLNKEFEYISLEEIKELEPFMPVIDLGPKGKKQIIIKSKKSNEINPIEEEIKSFIQSINTNEDPIIGLHAAQSALKLALDIAEQVTMNQN